MFKAKKSNTEKSEKGFTIIEVMIVLAIAGLILLIVFLAVPALQRNSRNTQRKNDASTVASAISEFESNNAGTTPTKVVYSGTPGNTEVDMTSQKFAIFDSATNTSTTISANTGTLPAVPGPDANYVILTKATCSGNSPSTTVASARSIVVWYGLEGGTKTGCIQA